MKRLILAITPCLLLLAASSANASFVAVGDPVTGGSWTQQFNESGVGLFNFVAVQMPTGLGFETATHRGFSNSSWHLAGESGSPVTLATAEGNSLSSLNWNIWFNGSTSSPLDFDFASFYDDTLRESVHASWDGHNWQFGSSSWSPSRTALEQATTIPAPGALLLGLLGIGGVGIVVRRFW